MKCKEFRNLLQTGKEEVNNTLEQHLSCCAECSEWVEKFIAEKPVGLNIASWETPTINCMPDISKYIVVEKEISMFASFKSGIKYGLVFGLAVVIALAIFNPGSNNNLDVFSTNKLAISSKIPSFYAIDNNFNKKNMFFVTDVNDTNSNIKSFVEDEKIPSFYEENLEESQWFETQSG